jgi:hypothetical protein
MSKGARWSVCLDQDTSVPQGGMVLAPIHEFVLHFVSVSHTFVLDIGGSEGTEVKKAFLSEWIEGLFRFLVSLAGPGWTDEEDALGPLGEATRFKALDQLCIDRGVEGKIKGLDRRHCSETGTFEQTVDPSGRTLFDLVGQEHREELLVGEIVPLGVKDPRFEMFPDPGELLEAKLVQELVVHAASPSPSWIK